MTTQTLTPEGKRLADALVKADHEFKAHPTVFHPARRGDKTFEFRKDDRGGYHVGQTVCLRCYAPETGYTDDAPLYRIITDILRPGEFGLQDGYCILSLRPLTAPEGEGAGLREAVEDARGVANVFEALWRDAEDETARLASGLRPSDEAIAEAFHEHRREREPSLSPWSEVKEGSGIWKHSHNFAARFASLPVAALASPQPAVEGPVAAGIRWAPPPKPGPMPRYFFQNEPVSAVLATLTPPADPKPTVSGNDAGMREPGSADRDRALERLAVEIEFAADIADPPKASRDRLAMAAHLIRGMKAALAPQTGSAGEDPKTPGAGVGERCPIGLDHTPGICSAGTCKACAIKRAAQPAPVGEDETGVREALDQVIDYLSPFPEDEPYLKYRLELIRSYFANQPPKAETPAGVGEFRVGRKVPRNVYRGNLPLFMAESNEHAETLVELLNAGLAALSAAPAARPGDGALAEIADLLPGWNPSIESSGDFVGLQFDLSGDARQFAHLLTKVAASRPAAAPAADGGRA